MIYSDKTKEKMRSPNLYNNFNSCYNQDVFGYSLSYLVCLVWLDCTSNVISPNGDTNLRYLYIILMCPVLYNRSTRLSLVQIHSSS